MEIQEFKKIEKSIIVKTQSLNAVVKCTNSILQQAFTMGDVTKPLYEWFKLAGIPMNKKTLSVKQIMKLANKKGEFFIYRHTPLLHHCSEFECVQYHIPLFIDINGLQQRPWIPTYYAKQVKNDVKITRVKYYRKVKVHNWSVALLIQLLEQYLFPEQWEQKYQKGLELLHTFKNGREALICYADRKRLINEEGFYVGCNATLQTNRDMGLA